jgi:hypothetical protein
MRIKQGQPGAGFNDINRRRPSESVFPHIRAVRQRVRHFQPTPEELEAAHQANPRAVRDLNAWYDRLNELFDYSSINGNCSVPQLDPNKNPYRSVRRILSLLPRMNVPLPLMHSYHLDSNRRLGGEAAKPAGQVRGQPSIQHDVAAR